MAEEEVAVVAAEESVAMVAMEGIVIVVEKVTMEEVVLEEEATESLNISSHSGILDLGPIMLDNFPPQASIISPFSSLKSHWISVIMLKLIEADGLG
ncbi:hypothetical protein HAX54_048726 [Datura stramonium]|uniref:Uncharacterized protein n=1 Tax=Datura stramonium TaxID=4076 RepID=A0ABS8SUR9_DATST|nr:hypothetical protein [Datura stramonium]